MTQHPPQLPATLPVVTTSTAVGINPHQNQLPTTLPVIQQQQQTSFATNMHLMRSNSLTNNAVSIDGYNNGAVTAGVCGGSVIVLPPLSAASVTVMNSSMTAQPTIPSSDNTVLVPADTIQSLSFQVTPHPSTSQQQQQQQQLHTDNTQQTYSLIQQPQTSVINMSQASYSSNTNSGIVNHPIYSVVPSTSSDSISSSNNARGEDVEMSPPPQLSHTTAVNGVGRQEQQPNLLTVLEQQHHQQQQQPQVNTKSSRTDREKT